MATEPVVQERPVHEPVPRRMQHLPIDPDRRMVVPWFVEWLNGKPEFRASSRRKVDLAITKRLCWVCGEQLETRFAFVAGPMCGINRTASEPPAHIECARWSARNCPFLNNPNMVRRQDEILDNSKLRETSPGHAITRNPGVVLLWITREYEVFPDGSGSYLIQMGKPHDVEFYYRGRAATRAEIDESIEGGIGALEAMARQEEGAMEVLLKARRQFEKLLPKK